MNNSDILIQDIIDFTNDSIKSWYKNVKEDYGIIGSGIASYSEKDNLIKVSYIEKGITKEWSIAFYPEYISNGIDWIYKCWQELS